MTSLYIITSVDCEKAGKFKVGIHTGAIKKLTRRYGTGTPEMIIKLFILLADGKAKEIEDKVKAQFATSRIANINGNDSEWYMVPLKTLYNFICPLLSEAAPLSSEEDEKKIQQRFEEFSKIMSPIEISLTEMERLIPSHFNSGDIADLLREIRLEKNALANQTFRGERLLNIRKLTLETYSKCSMHLTSGNPHYGQQIISTLRKITNSMDDVNRKFPETFKTVPRIIELNVTGTSKEDLSYRRAVFFGSHAGNTYIQRNWDELLNVDPANWFHLLYVSFNDAELSPKQIIKKKVQAGQPKAPKIRKTKKSESCKQSKKQLTKFDTPLIAMFDTKSNIEYKVSTYAG